jgi:PAS domain S-box-containing protein
MSSEENYCWGLSSTQIEQVFRESTELVCLMRLGHNFSRVNSKWKEVLGWEETELLKCSYLNFIHPGDIEKTVEYENHFIPTGFYNRWRCKDGTYRYLSWTGLAPMGSSPRTERPTFSIVRDITLEFIAKEAREAKVNLLSEQLEFNNSMIQSISDLTRLYLGPLLYLVEAIDGDNLVDLVRHFVQLTGSSFGLLVQEPKKETHVLLRDLVFSSYRSIPFLSEPQVGNSFLLFALSSFIFPRNRSYFCWSSYLALTI